jgi:signal transduction histidine kinase
MRPRLTSAGVILAEIVVVAAATVNALVQVPDPPLARIVVGAAALLALVIGTAFAIDADRKRVAGLLLAIQVVLGVEQLAAQQGRSFVIVLPILGTAAFMGSLRGGAVLGALYAVEIVLLTGDHAAASATGFVSATIFVLFASQLAVRERAARERIQELAVEVSELAAAQERNRIAREIHDSVGHGLTVVSVQMEAAKKLLDVDPPRAREHVERAQAVAKEALAEVRRSVAVLRKPGNDRPLVDAVRALVDECHGEIDAELRLEGTPRALSPAIEFALYRAVQEALTNVRRHANARAAQIVLAFTPQAVDLRVKDDGVGAAEVHGGFGLVGMRERAELLGGTVAVDTRPGAGFELRITLPA